MNIYFKLFILSVFLIPTTSLAAGNTGTIQDPYAWGENTGWVNFAPSSGNIVITDTAITGYAWDSIYGWINMAPPQSGVINDGQGTLSGYAWSEGGGYISFTGVSIGATGIFTGTAQGTDYGRISFDCASCSVTTDWRPTGPTPTPTPSPSPSPSPDPTTTPTPTPGSEEAIAGTSGSSIYSGLFANRTYVAQMSAAIDEAEKIDPEPHGVNRPPRGADASPHPSDGPISQISEQGDLIAYDNDSLLPIARAIGLISVAVLGVVVILKVAVLKA